MKSPFQIMGDGEPRLFVDLHLLCGVLRGWRNGNWWTEDA
jgi:hypothetical protein